MRLQATAILDLTLWSVSKPKLCEQIQREAGGLRTMLLRSMRAAPRTQPTYAAAAVGDACEAMHILLQAATAAGSADVAVADATALLAYAYVPGRLLMISAQSARLQRLVAAVRRGKAAAQPTDDAAQSRVWGAWSAA